MQHFLQYHSPLEKIAPPRSWCVGGMATSQVLQSAFIVWHSSFVWKAPMTMGTSSFGRLGHGKNRKDHPVRKRGRRTCQGKTSAPLDRDDHSARRHSPDSERG